jgi:arylsulfatase A-like enzyme
MNLIVIVLDTFRSDIIGPGNKLSFVRTPNLDQFAREGTVFREAYGEAQPTLQARRAFLTGKRGFPWRYNFDRRGHWHHAPGWHKIPPEHITVPEILTNRGYLTGMIADVFHMFKPTMNYTRGFTNYRFIRGQESDNFRSGSVKSVEERLKRHVREPVDVLRHANLIQYLLNTKDRKLEEDYFCAQVMQGACQWLDETAGEAPFMLWVEAFDPHEPWDPPRSYADAYFSDYNGKDFIVPGAGLERGPMSDEEIERTKGLYFGEVTFVDKWVGTLLEKIDSLGLRDDTAVMILSDHGTQVWDKGSFGKGVSFMHPFNTGMVWMMRGPGIPAGKKIDALVQGHDVTPTMMELLGVPFQGDGVSVLPLISGKKEKLREEAVIAWSEFAEGHAPARVSVRTDSWNFVHAAGRPEKHPELYDIKNDPEEDRNVISEHPEQASRFIKSIEAVIGSPVDSPMPELCDREISPMLKYLRKRSP